VWPTPPTPPRSLSSGCAFRKRVRSTYDPIRCRQPPRVMSHI
jgi:hypothetical protein